MERREACPVQSLCLRWDRPIKEGHGHEMLAQCPAVGQDLLWLELTATREILDGNFKWKSAVCESPSGKQSAEGAGGEAPCAALPAPAPEDCLGNSWSCELVQDSSGDPQKGRVKIIRSLFCTAFARDRFCYVRTPLGLAGIAQEHTKPRQYSSPLFYPCLGQQIPLSHCLASMGDAPPNFTGFL